MALLFLIAGSVVVLDQLTKVLIMNLMPVNTGHVIISGFFNLIHVRNTGAAFSMLAGAHSEWRRFFFIGMTLIVIGVIVYAYGKVGKEDLWTRTAYALITGGAAGNLVDRLRFGEVVDFLQFYIGSWSWPAFNVADSALSAGAVMLLISLLRGRQ